MTDWPEGITTDGLGVVQFPDGPPCLYPANAWQFAEGFLRAVLKQHPQQAKDQGAKENG